MREPIIDARGQLCPKPLILTRDALRKLAVDQPMTVLIDNQTSKENACRFLKDQGAEFTCTEDNGVFTIRVVKRAQASSSMETDVAQYCTSSTRKPHTIAFNKRTMGFGAEELGEILIKAFINTIREASPLPGSIVFYNDGIHLAIEGSPVIDALRELETIGVKILVCGTCLDYYGKKPLLCVGTASNMYDILQTLTEAGHIITP
ncbi:MAG: sulfurtransferase-like selenium metabolism protein YedF [Pirellulales bacterium]|nr:sulfurtransferase-like selenium metabolism protein YedF [Pirellulales bacterium]